MRDGTVALQMIVKDEYEQVLNLLESAWEYFSEVNVTVSDKLTYNKLSKLGWHNVKFKYRTWTDRFDEARNDNLKMCGSKWFFWLDADDEFPFAEIPKLVEYAEENDVDAIFLPYNYAQNEEGESITRHWRERLIRRDAGFEWRGWVHETLISDEPYTSHKINLEVKHNSGPEHVMAAIERNHSILEKAYAETNDPRYLHYLGMSEFSHGNYNRSAELLTDYLKVGGSVEDTYRALSVISECAYKLGKFDMAMEYAFKCTTLKPEYPMGYWLIAQYEADNNNWDESLEWIKVSETKPDPETLSVWDPSSRDRARLMGAQAEFHLGHYNNALAWLRKIPKNKDAIDLASHFQNEADAETFVKLLPKMMKFFKDPKTMYESLTHDIKYDTRLRDLRWGVTEPKTWNNESIVIFCGQGYEEWGPSTLDKGMGGSEEAVVYLSRELTKLGYNVTVFSETEEQDFVDKIHFVDYRPWKEIDARDEFNIFISWRAPQYAEKVNAKVKIADIHDVLPKALIKDYPDVTYMFKSKFHKDLYPDLPDKKSEVIGNGINKREFK